MQQFEHAGDEGFTFDHWDLIKTFLPVLSEIVRCPLMQLWHFTEIHRWQVRNASSTEVEDFWLVICFDLHNN